jgi:hypothetical protein
MESKDAIKNKLPQWEIGPRYQANEVVGKGSYGQVIKALDRFVLVSFFTFHSSIYLYLFFFLKSFL